MITPRKYHTATLLANGQVLATGGEGNSGFLASAELYGSSSSAPITLGNSTWLAGGAFQFTFTNTPGLTFRAFASPDATTPFSTWTSLGSVQETAPGQFQFTDPQAKNFPLRFYDVRWP
jgi:hypothetical protein